MWQMSRNKTKLHIKMLKVALPYCTMNTAVVLIWDNPGGRGFALFIRPHCRAVNSSVSLPSGVCRPQ